MEFLFPQNPLSYHLWKSASDTIIAKKNSEDAGRAGCMLILFGILQVAVHAYACVTGLVFKAIAL